MKNWVGTAPDKPSSTTECGLTTCTICQTTSGVIPYAKNGVACSSHTDCDDFCCSENINLDTKSVFSTQTFDPSKTYTDAELTEAYANQKKFITEGEMKIENNVKYYTYPKTTGT